MRFELLQPVKMTNSMMIALELWDLNIHFFTYQSVIKRGYWKKRPTWLCRTIRNWEKKLWKLIRWKIDARTKKMRGNKNEKWRVLLLILDSFLGWPFIKEQFNHSVFFVKVSLLLELLTGNKCCCFFFGFSLLSLQVVTPWKI